MTFQKIDYKETGFFSPLVTDYLSENPQLSKFYQFPPKLSSFSAIIENRRKRIPDREILVSAIRRGYEILSSPINTKVVQNINALLEEKTFTVTTGHQLNLFSGPLYTIYKILSTIRLAEEINKTHPELKIVPIFWMATEDHDFPEINHVKVHDKTISWEIKSGGVTGKISTDSIGTVVSRFMSSLGLSSNLGEIEELIKNSYLQYPTLAEATMAFYHQIFESLGLVILDADNPQLKAEFKEILHQEFIDQKSYELVNQSNQDLVALSYPSQIHPRPINLFYLEKGSRERFIKESDNEFSVLNSEKKFNSQELHQLIESNPELFSPNVVLRPVYQEIILPNLAYIGGGAEVSYWLSLKSTFDHFKVPYPAVFLRNSALLLEPKQEAAIHRLGFKTQQIFEDSRELIKKYVLRSTSKRLNLEVEKNELILIFERIKSLSENIDPTLGKSSEALKTKILNKLTDLEKKMLRKEKNSFDIQISQIIKIKQTLFPNYALQERNENYFPFYQIYGKELLNILHESLDPLDPRFTIITLPPKNK